MIKHNSYFVLFNLAAKPKSFFNAADMLHHLVHVVVEMAPWTPCEGKCRLT